jgi:hypothetical protein
VTTTEGEPPPGGVVELLSTDSAEGCGYCRPTEEGWSRLTTCRPDRCVVLLGESHLRAAVRAFIVHYHEERLHQGLDNQLIAPATPVSGTGPLRCRARLGGLLKFYDREAA